MPTRERTTPVGQEIDPIAVIHTTSPRKTSLSISSELEINEELTGLLVNEPTALLIDINNFYRRAKDNGFKIDYLALKSIFESRCNLRYIGAFTAVDRQDPESIEWVNQMIDFGYDVVTKDLKRYSTPSGVSTKGNMDVEIAVAAALNVPSTYKHIILGTCDGDFVALVKTLREKDPERKVSVLGVKNVPYRGMSEDLVKAATHFYDIAAFLDHVTFKVSDV